MSESVSLLAGHYETTKTDHFTRRLIEAHFEFDWIPASAGMTAFFCDSFKNAVPVEEAICCDAADATLADLTNPVIPVKAESQSKRNYNPAWLEMTRILTHKNVSTDSSALPELY